MARNFSSNPVTNAAKRAAVTQSVYFVEGPDGLEERTERRPQGRTERFVDKEGNVVTLVMYAEGDQRKAETERRNRGNYHLKGMIELAQCPLVNGAQQYATRDFIKLPAHLREQCREVAPIFTKNGRDIYAKQGCPHVEWLIEHRRKEAAKAFAVRNAHVARAEDARKREDAIKELQLQKLAEDLGVDSSDPEAIKQAVTRKPRRKAKEPTE